MLNAPSITFMWSFGWHCVCLDPFHVLWMWQKHSVNFVFPSSIAIKGLETLSLTYSKNCQQHLNMLIQQRNQISSLEYCERLTMSKHNKIGPHVGVRLVLSESAVLCWGDVAHSTPAKGELAAAAAQEDEVVSGCCCTGGWGCWRPLWWTGGSDPSPGAGPGPRAGHLPGSLWKHVRVISVGFIAMETHQSDQCGLQWVWGQELTSAPWQSRILDMSVSVCALS